MLLNTFLGGAIVMASWAISVFFFRFQRATRDRLFGFFAAAFFLLGLERLAIEFLSDTLQAHVYLIRLAAFVLMLIGIWDKNRKESQPKS